MARKNAARVFSGQCPEAPRWAMRSKRERRNIEITVADCLVESDRALCHHGGVRRWQELSIEIVPEAADALSAWLVDRGAPGIIEEEVGERIRLRAHFAEGEEVLEPVRAFLDGLENLFPGSASANVTTALVDEEDWAAVWKQGFPPVDVGRRLRIRPPWSDAAGDGRCEIEIMPAMAFGTGHHATTVGCLLAIEALFEREGGRSPVLDVGTGSGILAIAAARLGAERVLAIDTDPVAVEAAADNVRRNAVSTVVAVQLGSIDAIDDRFARFALIVANLHAAAVRTLLAPLRERTLAGGALIISGLLDADAAAIGDAAAAAGWIDESQRSIDGWTTIVLRRRD
jgi:ribosomal protein L11 methyltransferase